MEEIKIDGVSLEKGLESCEGNINTYFIVLKSAYLEGKDRKDLIAGYISGHDYKNYHIAVHGIKSIMASIGAMEVSELARQQEMAVKQGDFESVEKGAPVFMECYERTLENIKAFLQQKGLLKSRRR